MKNPNNSPGACGVGADLRCSPPSAGRGLDCFTCTASQRSAQQERFADSVSGLFVSVSVADDAVRDARLFQSGFQRLVRVPARRDDNLVAGERLFGALLVGNHDAFGPNFLDRRVHVFLDVALVQMAVVNGSGMMSLKGQAIREEERAFIPGIAPEFVCRPQW